MLEGLMGALLRMDKTSYAVGEVPTYFIAGARPGAAIAWSSFLNGQPTGEFQAQYGQHVGANGSATLTAAQAWSASNTGQWEKELLLVNPDGSFDHAKVDFTVGAVNAGTGQGSGGGGSFFSGSVDIPGLGAVPNLALAAAAGLFVLAISGGRRR